MKNFPIKSIDYIDIAVYNDTNFRKRGGRRHGKADSDNGDVYVHVYVLCLSMRLPPNVKRNPVHPRASAWMSSFF